MKLIPTTPALLQIKDPSDKELVELRKHLTYIDRRVDFELYKFKNSHWARQSPDYHQRLQELQDSRKKSLLVLKGGEWFTHSGLAKRLSRLMNPPVEKPAYSIPEPKLVPYENTPPYTPYPYQNTMVEKLLATQHGAVEAATGLGKSFCITLIAKRLGLKTVIMAPSVSIAEQLLADFTKYFGKRKVGQFFGGKKESGKLFTIAVAASLTRLEPGDDHWDNLSKAAVFLADESHLCPAATLEKVCMGLLEHPSYRYFFSGTQLRQDGLDLLLEGLIGPVVFEMNVEQGVDAGFLAKPMFRMIRISSKSVYQSSDANNMTRQHLYYNKRLNLVAGSMASGLVSAGKQVLILIDELEQFTCLLPHFRHPVAFAHGGVTAENATKIPPEYHESDPNALVKKFNAGDIPILVGTSCISTGTDVRNNKATIYLVGGKSEIAVRQGAIGRSTRIVPAIGKKECLIYDFDVYNIPVLHKHATERAKIYQDTYPDYQEISGDR